MAQNICMHYVTAQKIKEMNEKQRAENERFMKMRRLEKEIAWRRGQGERVIEYIKTLHELHAQNIK